jgi:hypothetical protein
MKKIFLIGLLSFALGTTAQTKVKQDKNGNFTAVQKEKIKSDSTATGKTFTTSKGEVFAVYKSAQDKLFINRVSKKSGKAYRQYIKVEL